MLLELTEILVDNINEVVWVLVEGLTIVVEELVDTVLLLEVMKELVNGIGLLLERIGGLVVVGQLDVLFEEVERVVKTFEMVVDVLLWL